MGEEIEDIGAKVSGIIAPVTINFPRRTGDLVSIRTDVAMNFFVRGFHLVIRTKVGEGGDRSGRRGRISTTFDLHSALNVKFVRFMPGGIVNNVETGLAFETFVEFVEQGADSRGEIRGRGRAAQDGRGL
jgi:hypothetical protein